jgi:hypothetical protein
MFYQNHHCHIEIHKPSVSSRKIHEHDESADRSMITILLSAYISRAAAPFERYSFRRPTTLHCEIGFHSILFGDFDRVISKDGPIL